MSDFWTDAIEQEVAEPPKPTYEGLPDGATVLVRTTTSDDKETVHPKIKPITTGDGRTFYRLKVPVVVVGGDKKITAAHVGRYLFLDLNVERPTVEQLEKGIATATANGNEATANRLRGQLGALDKYPVAPETYNLILDTLAPEGANAAQRWAAARAILAAKGKELGYTPEQFEGNTQLLYASTFKEVLLAGPSRTVIGKVYTPKQREGSSYEPQQTVGSISAATPDERKRRKVAEVAKEDF